MQRCSPVICALFLGFGLSCNRKGGKADNPRLRNRECATDASSTPYIVGCSQLPRTANTQYDIIGRVFWRVGGNPLHRGGAHQGASLCPHIAGDHSGEQSSRSKPRKCVSAPQLELAYSTVAVPRLYILCIELLHALCRCP